MSVCGEVKSLKDLPNPLDSDHKCCVCLEGEKDNGGSWIFHNDPEGMKHPFHKKCSDYTIDIGKCPICRSDVDVSSVFTRTERFFNLARQISVKTLRNSGIIGALGLVAAKALDVGCNVLSNSSNCNIGTAGVGSALGFIGTLQVMYTVVARVPNMSVVQAVSNVAPQYLVGIAFDYITAGNDSYVFYGTMGACICLSALSFSFVAANQVYNRVFS